MNIESIVSIRSIDGFTSARCYNTHVLTSSVTGALFQWDIETSNPILSHNIEKPLDFVLPYRVGTTSEYSSILLQSRGDISILDLKSCKIHHLVDAITTSFARISLLNYGSSTTPCIIVPCEKNIKVFDLRIECGGINSNVIHTINPPVIQTPKKSEIGMLHTCKQFSALGSSYILSTYESASIVIHDLRNLKEPALPVHYMDTFEAIPALSTWKDVVLIGDTGGLIHMYHVTHQDGIRHIKSSIPRDPENSPGISSLDIRNDGTIFAAGCWDRIVRIYETRSLSLKGVINKHYSNIIDASFDKTGNTLCTASKDGIANVLNVS
ncbi:hypothetical protein BEWA_011650 [Theileria equi strain WA]|uniref:Uncharacterized protein n=1 Tax=Theileria equi strain WA TaxID=1537102 RepID=L0B1K4_THEEQ|nr:hypothetical protein BEWA_011650 [Theileria equi strain WA]AFZ81747.1 hypothetical protein BEWA_011650 [Theileria equi strain WA]|eukprot:XP_004831413.1 hypothetical protein BEWA_011650 [Theileria equi strain WA]